MLRDIVRFEWRYHTRQISFLAASLLFFLFGFALGGTGFGPANVNVDSPYSIAQSLAVLSLSSVFVLAVFCANAVVRDRETRMEEIVFTTSVEKLPFLLGRFTGSFLAAFTAFSTSALGMFAARFMPWHDPDRLGAIDPLAYLWALLVIVLPNVLFAAVTLFALATVTRSVFAAYAGSVALWVLYFVGAAMTGSPIMAASAPGASAGSASVAALLDPFALSAFFEQTQHWIPAVRNTRLVSLSGNFLLNRLLWIGVSLAMLAAVYRLFSFRVSAEKKKRTATAAIEEAVVAPSTYAPVFTQPSQWRAYLSATRMEIRTFLLSLPFLAMLLLWGALAAFEIVSDVTGGEYGASFFPAPGMIFATLQTPLALVATILLVYISGEIVWRERALRFAGIVNATPASNGVFVASKCTALAALIAALTATGLLAGALVQLARGWPADAALLPAFAYFAAAPLVLFAIAAVVIQTLSPHKYLGMLIVLAVAVVARQGQAFGLRHPLLRFASAPPVTWSDMNGFGRTAGFHWLMLYWAALAGLLLLVAIAAWRGTRIRVRRGPAIALAALFVAIGALLFFNTQYTTRDESLAWRADYEKRYKTFETLAQPRVRAIHATVELEPDARRFRVRGEYLLANETSTPIARVLIAMPREERAHQEIIPFDPPLAPGARARLRFTVTHAPRGFETGDPDTTILANGAYIPSHRAFPSVGYRAGYELDEPRERRRYGLPPSKPLAQPEIATADWIALDLTVTTTGDQTVVTPGRLVRAWDASGRRAFHFRTDAPIPNQFIIASARYAVARATQGGVAIEVYHHPAHTQNVDRIVRAASESVRSFSSSFGPYPHPHLRLAEVPAQLQNFSGFALPGVIFLGENRGFLVDARDPRKLDLVHRRVAHEVAHQWWGYTLIPLNVPGATVITESLTKYAELMAIEKAYGREHVRQSLTYELDRYLADRTSETGSEPPLARAADQPYLYYRKGALVMYALRDLLGEAAVNAALRNMLREHGGPGGRPTTTHLVQQLRAVSNANHHPLIDQWMNDVVLYDLKLESAASRKRTDGRYDVTLRVSAAKQRDNGQSLPFAEEIEIGLFSADDKPLHLAKHPLRAGVQEIAVIVDREPAFAAVDPYVTRIDGNRFDNGRAVDPR